MPKKALKRIMRRNSLKISKRSKKNSKNNHRKRAKKKLSGYIPFETLVKLLRQPGKKQDVLELKKPAINEKKSNKENKDEFVPLRELLRKINKKKGNG